MARIPRKQSASNPASLLERDGFIDSGALAEYLDVPVGTLDQWASRGGGPPFHKVGRFRRYHPADVREWLATQRRAPERDPQPAA
ncbi:MAG TPA: helix-turn-helix domain-containing protein [Streptosporangiaceae bacterium]|nr:helix-turn-helix domain-containing protein [Streptosporangiaceae bacterium]